MLLSIALCLLADTQGYYRQPALHDDTIVSGSSHSVIVI